MPLTNRCWECSMTDYTVNDKTIHIGMIKEFYMLDNAENLDSFAVLCSSYEVSQLRCTSITLLFDDTTNKHHPGRFTRKMADTISEKIKENADKNNIYICCDSGESRSTAIAAAVIRFYNYSDKIIWKNPHFHPNLLVYELMCKGMQLSCSKLRLWYNKKVSDYALKKALKR